MTYKATRRHMLALGLGAGTLPLAACLGMPGEARSSRPVPLPTASTIRRDYQRMVDFGARLPGHPNHIRYVDSMAKDFADIGLQVGPCESFAYRRWDPIRFGLTVETELGSEPVSRPAYYVRSAPTPSGGVSGPLHYGGTLSESGPDNLQDVPEGSIVVLDAKLPVTNVRNLVDLAYIHVPEDEREAYLDRPYKRLWQTPAYRLEEALEKGAAGVVIIMDVSSDMIENNFSPHNRTYKPPLPALFVGRDTGDRLREQARAGLPARLTLEAEWVDCQVPQITATLPGESEETIIIDTHTDGQNFIEENGCVAMLQLARHFASLPAGERLKRTLVFVGWPGHMAGGMPEAEGWMLAHRDIVDRAVAAFTLEHFGAPEWDDIPGKGYAPTGRNEYMNYASTQGVLADLVKQGFETYDLSEHGIERAPGTTTGAAFHASGIPHVGAICGPNYLLGIMENGHMDKLDADLAARQTRMMADLIKQVDKLPADLLKAGDDTLGASPIWGETDTSSQAECFPA